MIVEGFMLRVLVSLPVGPVSIGLVQRGFTWGFWNATMFGSGSVSADLVYISLVYWGIAPYLSERLWLWVALWGLGTLWLAWLGIDAIRGAMREPEPAAPAGASGNRQGYLAGVGITLLNPLTIAGWLTLGGGFFALHPQVYTLGGGWPCWRSLSG